MGEIGWSRQVLPARSVTATAAAGSTEDQVSVEKAITSFVAADLGAESGRVMLGRFDGAYLTVRSVVVSRAAPTS